MIIFKSINKLNKKVNFKANIGFVPTMGALHKGHISLIKSSKLKCKKTLVSIFVNPSQFNKVNDYKKYPKKLNRDIKILKKLNVNYLLIPKLIEIYKNKKSMKIKMNKKDKILCAKFRPGHFEGVLAVIKQFLKNIKPKYMFLGEKDYQQIYLIKKFIKNKFNTKIISCKTIRLKNSLPYSSRNFLLSKNEIIKASIASKIIKRFYLSTKKNFKNIRRINSLKNEIESKKIKIEYLEARNKINFSKKIKKTNFKIFISFYMNNIRLIDNL
jgi:pantoate--beta-alanine ligase